MIASLGRRMGLLFLAFFLLVTTSVAATFWIIRAQTRDALVINLAGRQRMLLETIVWSARELAARPEMVEDREKLLTAVVTFDGTLKTLVDGGAVLSTSGETITLPEARSHRARQAPGDARAVERVAGRCRDSACGRAG